MVYLCGIILHLLSFNRIFLFGNYDGIFIVFLIQALLLWFLFGFSFFNAFSWLRGFCLGRGFGHLDLALALAFWWLVLAFEL